VSTARVIPGAEPFRFDAGAVGAVLVHGFSGSPASMRPLGEYLSQNGISVVGPRLAGHGTRWEDLEPIAWVDWERDAEAALTDLSSRCPQVVLVGLSMGGAMVLHLGAKLGDRVKGVVVINPDIRRPALALAPVLRLFTRSRKGVGNDIKRPGQDEICYDRIPIKALGQLGKLYRTAQGDLPSVRVPLLVFSADEDHVAKPSNSRLVMARAGTASKELVRLGNSYHVATLDYDADLIGERTLQFIRTVTGPE
jgi:carboxylesterase